MNILAFDTGTEHLSVALACMAESGQQALFSHEGVGGPQASVALIPTILDLLAQAGLRLNQLHVIAFGAGPGSFTGLRSACAVAQGLGFGANLPLLPVDSLLAVAEAARFGRAPELRDAPFNVVAVLDARMGEVYAAGYRWQVEPSSDQANQVGQAGHWVSLGQAVACQPQALAALIEPTAPQAQEPQAQEPQEGQDELAAKDGTARPAPWILAGNAWAAYGERLLTGLPAGTEWIESRPRADALLRLAPSLLAAGAAVPAAQAWPRYIRDKVAKTSDERAAEKAALADAGSVPSAPLSAAPSALAPTPLIAT